MNIVLNADRLDDEACSAMHKAAGAAAAAWAAEKTWRRLAADELRLDLLSIAAKAPPGRVIGFSFTAEMEYLGLVDGSALRVSVQVVSAAARGAWAWVADEVSGYGYFDSESAADEITAEPEVYALLFRAVDPEDGGG